MLVNQLSIIFLICLVFSCSNGENEGGNYENKPSESKENKPNGIVSLNGTLTEILVALKKQDEIIGVDVTSTYPSSLLSKVKKVGSTHNLSIEGILSLNPKLIMGKLDNTRQSIKDYQIESLNKTGVETNIYKQTYSVHNTKDLIQEIATDMNVDSLIVDSIFKDIDSNLALVKIPDEKLKVLFIYARANLMFISGTNTPFNSIIELANATNAIQDFEGFKPISKEALIMANPDCILLFQDAFESFKGIEGVLRIPEIGKTNAGKNKKIIAMDGLLLSGFGARLGQAVLELNRKIYPEIHN